MSEAWRQELATVVGPAVARSATIGEILIAPGAVARAGEMHRRAHGEAPAILIADDNTFAAAGAAVEASLGAAGVAVSRLVLPGAPRPKPTLELAERVRSAVEAAAARPLVVGAGVLNDVVKLAAHRLGLRYGCVATAASMDGYASAGSPLTDQGFKKTIQCRPPVAILADLDVIAAAPREMNGWGFGDLAGKIPAGGDWIVADALGIEPIDEVAWPLVQAGLRGWLSDPDGVARGAPGAVAGLCLGLTVVGLAMEAHGSSRPASGADHQIAHLWEMEELSHGGELVSHGACVGVGTLTVLGLFDWLLEQDLARLDVERIVAAAPSLQAKRAAIDAAFPRRLVAERAMAETAAKHLDPAAHRARLARLAVTWPELRRRLRAQLMTRDEMAALLARAGAPVRAAEIGVDPRRHRTAVAAARFLRSRYTVLDLLDETGLLEPAVDAIFSQPFFQAA